MSILGSLGDLVLALSADTSKFQSDLGKADRLAKKFGKEVGQALGNLAGALVAIGGSAGFGALIKSQIDAADAAGKMAQKIGVSTEALSAYMVAAKLSDVSNEQLQTGFQQLARNQADFVKDTGEAKEAFIALGISVEQINAANGDTAKIFEMVAGKLSQFEDGANKTAIAMRIFGKSGAELIPLINSLDETRGKASALGRIIDSETAKAAEKFNDTMTEAGLAVQGFGLTIAKAVLPTLQSMSDELLATVQNTEKMEEAARIADGALRIFASTGTVVAAIFIQVGKTIGAIFAAAEQYSQGNVRQAFDTLADAGSDWGKQFDETLKTLRKQWEGYNETVDHSMDGLYNFGKAATGTAAPAMRNLAEETKKASEEAKKAKEAFDAMKDAIMRSHDDAMATIDADKEIERIKQAQRDLQTDIDEMIERARTNPDQADKDDPFGTGQGSDHAKRLKELRLSLMTEEEEELFRHQERLREINTEFTDDELESLGGRHTVEQELEQEHQRRLLEIRSRGLKTLNAFTKSSWQQQAATIFGELASITAGVAQHDKKMFQLNKIAATANAIVNTYQGVTRTLAVYPWPIAPVMAALHLAAGLAQVRAIKSASFGGGAIAPSVVGTAAATPVTPVDSGGTPIGRAERGGPTTVINVQGKDTDTLSLRQMREILKGIEEATRDGGRVFVA